MLYISLCKKCQNVSLNCKERKFLWVYSNLIKKAISDLFNSLLYQPDGEIKRSSHFCEPSSLPSCPCMVEFKALKLCREENWWFVGPESYKIGLFKNHKIMNKIEYKIIFRMRSKTIGNYNLKNKYHKQYISRKWYNISVVTSLTFSIIPFLSMFFGSIICFFIWQ